MGCDPSVAARWRDAFYVSGEVLSERGRARTCTPLASKADALSIELRGLGPGFVYYRPRRSLNRSISRLSAS